MVKLRKEFKITQEDFKKLNEIKSHLGIKTNSKTISKLINEFDFLKNKKNVKIIINTLFFDNKEIPKPALFLISKSVIKKITKTEFENIILELRNDGLIYEPRENILKRL